MICCIGDTHIDRMHGIIPNGPSLVIQTLDDIYESMKAKGVKHFVWLGDVFHTPYAEEDSWYALIDFFHRHKDVKTHIIVGNHDMESAKRYSIRFFRKAMKLKWLNGKVYLKPEVIELSGDKYFMCPHPYVTDAPKGVRYAFGHFAFSGARTDNGKELVTGNEPAGRWILGDFHTPQSGKRFTYAGSICATSFAESNDKRVLLIESERLRSVSITPRLLLARTHITTELELKSLDTKFFWSVSFEPELIGKINIAKYPHIVKHTAPRKISKVAKALIKDVQSSDPLSDLDHFLMHKQGLSESDVKYARKILEGKDV